MNMVQTTIRLSENLKGKLQQQADEKGYTIKDLVLFILHDYFENIAQE